jgi:hypothetical protein
MATKTEAFIGKASAIHQHKYDYTLVEYINNSTNVIIICPIHGRFTQRPGNHLSGAQCKECSKLNRAATNLEKYGHPNIAHGTKKDKISTTNIERYGVSQSAASSNNIKKRKQTLLGRYGVDNPSKILQFQEKRKQTFLDRYGADNPSNVLLFQEKRKQTFLDRYGVPSSFKRLDSIEKSRNTCIQQYGVPHHTQRNISPTILNNISDFDWLYDQYITQQKSATKIAIELGVTTKTICTYLKRQEITLRRMVKFSWMCIDWLDSIMDKDNILIVHSLNSGEYNIPNTKLHVDGFCEATNTVYEFHGDYWHGNPTKYHPDRLNTTTNSTMGELYKKTIEREEKIRELGYELVIMWESDFNNH